MDQFQGILHRSPNLSNVHKLILLQWLFKGDVNEILKSTQIKEASFQGTCDNLTKRYRNKRMLLTHHMNSLLDLKACSTTNAREIHRVF